MKLSAGSATLILFFCAAAFAADKETQIVKARPLNRNTALMTAGHTPAILAPASEKYEAVAATLQKGIQEKLGVKPDRVGTLEAAQPGKRTIIAIGNMLTNPLITRLYFNGYSREDSLCPAGKAYVIRTAYDPYPWRGGMNIVILGCETPAGAERAAADFLQRLEGEGANTFLPYTLVVSEDAVPHTRVGSPHNRDEPITQLPAAGTSDAYMAGADAYLRTGKEEAGRRAVASLAAWAKGCRANPESSLHGTAWVKEFEFFQAVLPFEYCPLMTDALRLDMAWVLLKCADDMWDHGKGYPFGKGVGPTWNHNTEPLMGAYLAGRYLLHYYRIERCREYIDAARECFVWQNKSWRSAEDSSGYLTYSSLSGMRWALMEGDPAFFASGMARKHADFIITLSDQFGRPGGFGDGSTTIRIAHESLPLVFWFTRDADLLWYLNNYNRLSLNGDWPNPFWRDVTPKASGRFIGVKAVMMDPPLYARILKIPYYGEKSLPTTTVPVSAAVDKISLREGWRKESQFLMLDGLGRGHHLHYDTQAITTLQSDGEEWLMDRDYLERDPSSVSLLRTAPNMLRG